MSAQRYSVKAGRFTFDPQTKKVKVSKDPGSLSVYMNQQGQNHLTWTSLADNIQYLDIIVFSFDAVFQRVQSQTNTFLLRFQSNDDKYFFYLQEKVNPDQFVKNVNQKIASVWQEPQHMQIQQPVQKMQAQPVVESKPVGQQQQKKVAVKKLFSQDFLQRMSSNLRNNYGEGSITHLSKVITEESINYVLAQTSQQEKESFVQFLPQQQRDLNQLASNLKSPQFQQAVDALTDALNSQNAIPLFLELGLDQKYLKKFYGVHAFLKALNQWGKQQMPKQEMKEQEPSKMEQEKKQ